MTVNETPFSTVLIANRGEIACRVIRSAKAAGLKTVAIFSDADATAPHVKMADDARRVGPPPVSESYLVIQNILAAAKEAGADAIHPGYGFLSENAAFAAACADAGIVFIGPPINAIDLMGDKAKAKRRMIEAGVPCIPGYQGTDQSDATLLKEAQTIGLPIMVKAAAGGGGRGMRLVEKMDDLENAISTARSEAENAFGSGELILEKAVLKPRHVEIQIFADRHGNVVHLGERDCSVQRRHQKVLEEAPCPVMTPDLRNAMGDAAVKAARDIDYVGAGTVEFLLDQENKFYFLEMNTRLQVEHPVTEIVTGLDLVALQLRVARGAPLGLQQEDVRLSGHAIEARLYAEDPSQGFLPATGVVDSWQAPSGDGIRIDAGIETGSEISPFYDPMVAKIIGYGDTREEARRQLVHALKSTAFFGPASNRSFLIDALERQAFVDGEATTAFIGECFSDADLEPDRLTPFGAAIAATLLFEQCAARSRSAALPFAATLRNWSSATQLATPFRFDAGDGELTAAVTPLGDGSIPCCGGKRCVRYSCCPWIRPSSHIKGQRNAYRRSRPFSNTRSFRANDPIVHQWPHPLCSKPERCFRFRRGRCRCGGSRRADARTTDRCLREARRHGCERRPSCNSGSHENAA